ncbi:MAG: alpha/beta hydrolase [Bacilli bacterium]|nr:alpha/beta hydrolase [Bacilli bacterium]
MQQYHKKFLDLSNGERLAYLEEGKGKQTLLLIHGNMSSSIHWTPLIERLGNEYKIIAPDMRGFGDSSYKQRFDSLEPLADDIHEFYTKLGLKNFVIAGWSTGGGVAMLLAAKYPNDVKKIILMDSMSVAGYPIFKKDANGAPIIGQVYPSKEEMAKDPLQVAAAAKCIEDKNAPYMTQLWNLVIYNVGTKPSEEDNKIYLAETFKERCLIDIDWSLTQFNITSLPGFYGMGNGLANQIKQPMLILWGENDLTVPKIMTDQNVASFPQAKFEIIKGSGHSPLMAAPDKLAAEVKAFIG